MRLLGDSVNNGGFAVSDIVRRRDVAPELRRRMELWTGCLAGALHETEYRDMLAQVGFDAVAVEPTRVYRAADAQDLLPATGLDDLSHLDGAFVSAFIRATKPR